MYRYGQGLYWSPSGVKRDTFCYKSTKGYDTIILLQQTIRRTIAVFQHQVWSKQPEQWTVSNKHVCVFWFFFILIVFPCFYSCSSDHGNIPGSDHGAIFSPYLFDKNQWSVAGHCQTLIAKIKYIGIWSIIISWQLSDIKSSSAQ